MLFRSDRLFILISAKGLANNKNITLYFGGNTPSHVHTTIPSVGGSGLIKVINGIMQSSASALVDADVSASAAIAGSKIEAGYFALASATGNFITTQQTGLYAPAAATGSFVNNSQTGVSGSAIIGGIGTNFLCTGATNSIILGGNFITGTVCNTAYAQNFCAVGGFFKGIGSGLSNVVTLDPSSNIPAYSNNTVATASVSSAVLAANSSSLSAYYSAIIGGNINSICGGALTSASVVLGGMFNKICATANCSAILGGCYNCVENVTSAIVGGFCNGIKSCQSSIVGGTVNCLCSGAVNSVILGGSSITGTASNTVYTNAITAASTVTSTNFAAPLICTDIIIPNSSAGSCGSLIISSRGSTIASLQCGIILNASSSCICGSAHGSMVLGGSSNCIDVSKWNSAIIQGCRNLISASCSIILAGSGITASAAFTAYASNFCVAGGKYYGDASALTGLATGSFVTTAQTGLYAAAANTGNFITTSQTGAFGGAGVDLTDYVTYSNLELLTRPEQRCGFIVGSDFVNSGSLTISLNAGFSCSEYSSSNNFIASTNFSLISSGATNNGIVGGLYNEISDNVSNSVILGGQYITGTSNNTAYAINYCSYKGKYYGDGSALTGLATGSFITTGMTGAFGGGGADLSNYVTTGQFSSGLNFSNDYTSVILGQNTSNCIVDGANNSTIIASCNSCITGISTNAIIIGSNCSCSISSMNHGIIIGGKCNILCNLMSCDTIIIGGHSNCFYDTLLQSSRSVILGGSGIQANSTDTVFGNNFCAYNGKFYGDGSAITGLATGDFVVSSKCQVVARNIQPFHVCAVTRVASTNLNNALIEFQGGIGKAYLCDHDDASVDDCNLYAITNNGYCAAQFSAMILGNALYGGNIFTTSIRIDGVATSGAVLSQNKIINYQAFPTDDACVVVEDQQLKIYITGAQTGMHWGVRLDILGMQGYD